MSTDMKNPGRGGGRDSSKALPKIDPTSHMGRILEALQEGPQSAAELQWGLRIAHAPAAVRDLIAKGYRIEKHKHPRAEGRPIQRYHLVDEG